MNYINQSTPNEIARKVQAELNSRKWSVRRCADEFNAAHAQKISDGKLGKLDKDFVQRVRANKFRVVSERVVKLCLFLGLTVGDDVAPPTPLLAFCQKEILTLDRLSKDNPHLKQGIRSLLRSVLDVVGQGESNEIY